MPNLNYLSCPNELNWSMAIIQKSQLTVYTERSVAYTHMYSYIKHKIHIHAYIKINICLFPGAMLPCTCWAFLQGFLDSLILMESEAGGTGRKDYWKDTGSLRRKGFCCSSTIVSAARKERASWTLQWNDTGDIWQGDPHGNLLALSNVGAQAYFHMERAYWPLTLTQSPGLSVHCIPNDDGLQQIFLLQQQSLQGQIFSFHLGKMPTEA